ncbi:MAG: metalloregulator ArsR/SmtB family transcription factor [Bdellovibrionota bacterium]
MNIVDTYKLLADESRLRLLSILEKGYFNVQELTSILELGQSTVSHHLKLLGNSNLTKKRKEGTWTYYSLNQNFAQDPIEKIINNFFEVAKSLNGSSSLTELLSADKTAVQEVLNIRRDETLEFFDSIAGTGKELRPEMSIEDRLVEVIKNSSPATATFADLGCGKASLLKHLLPRTGETIGVDYSQSLLDEAKEVLGGLAASVDLRLGYLEHLPLADNSVQTALTYMVLHHVSAPIEALKEAYRVLEPGGQLLVVDLMPHNNDEMRERYGDRWLGFDPKEFQSWISECGFCSSNFEVLGENNEVFYLTAKK